MRTLVTTVTSLALVLTAAPVFAGPVTSLGNLKFSTRDEVKTTPVAVRYVFNRDLRPGQTKKVTDGAPGRTVLRHTALRQGETVLHRGTTTVSETPMRPAVFQMGRAGFPTSRGSYTRARVVTMESTAYLPNPGNPRGRPGRTASGRIAGFGIVAVDPRVIPLGTKLFVEGYGFALAADTGGVIKGNIIDVCLPTMTQVRNWGRRHVRVHIFNERINPRP